MCKRETNYCQTVLEYKYVKRATFYRQTRHHKSSNVRNAETQRTLPSHLLLCKELVFILILFFYFDYKQPFSIANIYRRLLICQIFKALASTTTKIRSVLGNPLKMRNFHNKWKIRQNRTILRGESQNTKLAPF